jgi:hypothetical protein
MKRLKLLWVFIALVCSFLLGYYLRPASVDRGKALSEMGTMPAARQFPAGMQMPQRMGGER